MSVKLLTEHNLEFLSLKGGCIGSSESTLVKLQHCWKSLSRAHFIVFDSRVKSTCSLKCILYTQFKKDSINIKMIKVAYMYVNGGFFLLQVSSADSLCK